MTSYCERAYEIPCSECSLSSYGRDCRNNRIGAAGLVSLERERAQDRERKAAGETHDIYGNAYITEDEFRAWSGM